MVKKALPPAPAQKIISTTSPPIVKKILTKPIPKMKGKPAPPKDKYIRYPDSICANDFVNPEHDALYRDSIDN